MVPVAGVLLERKAMNARCTMNTTWVLRTNGDPQGAVVSLLGKVWQRAAIDRMLAPTRNLEPGGVEPTWLTSTDALTQVDLFAPLMKRSAARELATRPAAGGQWTAAVLRPCESRAVSDLARREKLPRDRLLTIAFDCLSTMSEEDYLEREAREGSADRMIDEAQQFARQGGILAYRNRRACQACPHPTPGDADLVIGLIGLPVRKAILLVARDEATAQRLGLAEIADGPASDTLVESRIATAAQIVARNRRAAERFIQILSSELPSDIDELIAFFDQCEPCQHCLDSCAIYDGELVALSERELGRAARVGRWLAACVGCGMCEQACPRNLPLTALHDRLASLVRQEAVH
jgi:formate dehydrogenase (coenzyme F420) beta subunit